FSRGQPAKEVLTHQHQSSTVICSTFLQTTACSAPTTQRPARTSTSSDFRLPSAPHQWRQMGSCICRAKTATCLWSKPADNTNCFLATQWANPSCPPPDYLTEC